MGACPFKNDVCENDCKFYDSEIDCKCLILYACIYAKIKFKRLMKDLAETGANQDTDD